MEDGYLGHGLSHTLRGTQLCVALHANCDEIELLLPPAMLALEAQHVALPDGSMTCWASESGSRIDHFLMSKDLLPYIRVWLEDEVPWWPHVAIVLERALPLDVFERRRLQRPASLPAPKLFGDGGFDEPARPGSAMRGRGAPPNVRLTRLLKWRQDANTAPEAMSPLGSAPVAWHKSTAALKTIELVASRWELSLPLSRRRANAPPSLSRIAQAWQRRRRAAYRPLWSQR